MARRHTAACVLSVVASTLFIAPPADAVAQTGRGRGAVIVAPARPGAGPDTGRLAELRRASLEAARTAMGLVRDIRITPDTIRLEVGGRLALDAFMAVGLDSAGRPVPGFVPLFSIANGDVARMELPGSGLLGMSAGRTFLRASGTIPGEARRPGEVRVVVQVPIIVTESSSPVPRPETDSVPRDLVLALLGQGTRNPLLRVGGAANGFPAELATGWRVLGSSQAYNTQSTSVFAAPYMSLAAFDTIESRLSASGWTMPAADRPPVRGFVAAFSTQGRTNVRCLGTDHLWWSATSRRPNESQIVVVITRATTTGVCSRAATSRPAPADAMPVLLLRAPVEIILQQSRNAGTAVEWTSEAVARGQTVVANLGRHFAAQVVAAGWSPVDSSISPSFEVRRWRITAGGRSWQAQLTVTSEADLAPTHLQLTVGAIPP